MSVTNSRLWAVGPNRGVEAFTHPASGAPGFWVPRNIWIEAERRWELYPLRNREIAEKTRHIAHLREALTIMTRTATTAQTGRDACWALAAQQQTAIESLSKSCQEGDSWPVRIATALGPASLVAAGCALAR